MSETQVKRGKTGRKTGRKTGGEGRRRDASEKSEEGGTQVKRRKEKRWRKERRK